MFGGIYKKDFLLFFINYLSRCHYFDTLIYNLEGFGIMTRKGWNDYCING